ncbi:7763_t:CDS:1, partial [Racocetra fulgida]
KVLVGALKMEEFTNLWTLIIFSQQIVSLNLNDCLNLKEVVISNCLKELIKNKEVIRSNLVFNTEKTKLVRGLQVISVKENDIRNILIIGMTGSG